MPPESFQYTLFDAATILLREGMEALLVILALLACLDKSGHRQQSRWLWIGAAVGLLAALLTAVGIHLFFTQIALHWNQDWVKGGTGVFAAVMLFSVSYWLHRKSSLQSWQRTIQTQVATALDSKRLISLALITFLAVYREGAETILFYIGIAPSIRFADLLGGFAVGSVLLLVIAFALLQLGLKLPLQLFFRSTSLLLYILGFKFLGSGLHALQKVGAWPIHPIDGLPTWKTWSIYPTWETLVPQLALLGITAIVLLVSQFQHGASLFPPGGKPIPSDMETLK
jgi:high-affinity iron transporter